MLIQVRFIFLRKNHGYVVDAETIKPDVAEVGFINVNDGTVEGLNYKDKDIFTVQFHPEACAGPQDTEALFDKFIENNGGKKICLRIRI